jgi:hypothetical protein
MENDHIISGLVQKRADIAGAIAAAHDQLRALQGDLAHVEATARLFQPDIDFSGSRVSRLPGKHAAAYGQMSTAVRDVLRGVVKPQTIKAIAAEVVAARGLDVSDTALTDGMQKRVGASLRNLKRRGQAESRHGQGLALEWVLVDQNN